MNLQIPGVSSATTKHRTLCYRRVQVTVAALLWLLTIDAIAQTCNTNDITLNSQAEVDAFQATYGPCTQIAFKLTISGSDIENLDSLSALTTIGTDLTIDSNDSLTSLGGLANLISTGNQLRIQNNPALEDVALVSFSTVGTDLTIDNNDSLRSLDGLEGIVSTGNQLRVQNNTVLTDLDGLAGFERVGTDLSVLNNPRLTSCTGIVRLVDDIDDGALGPGPGSGGVPDVGAQVNFGGNLTGCNSISQINAVAELIAGNQTCNTNDISLGSQADVNAFQTTYGPCTRVAFRFSVSGSDIVDLSPLIGLSMIGSDLSISANDALESLAGLGNIVSTGNQVRIENNPVLTSAGLSSLTTVGTDLTIDSNDSLTSLGGLANLISTGNQLRIQNNPALEDVALVSFSTVGTDLTIDNNDSLRSLDGLEGIVSTGNQLRVQNNEALRSISGLRGFLSVGTDLTVANNPLLSACAGILRLIDAVDDGAPGPGPGSGGVPDVGAQVNISANRLGCNSLAEVLDYVFVSRFQ